MKLLVATTNLGKIREIRLALGGLHLDLVTLADIAPIAEPDETGVTFAENAALKARYYAAHAGLPTVAEDSGLVIDALGGAPGVLSARYPGTSYAEKFANLYSALGSHARPWTARFVCALAYLDAPNASDDEAMTFECEGLIEGEIASAPHGLGGFGYDPIFFYPPYGKTMGEATDEEKLAVSHRGHAFSLFRGWIERTTRA